MTRDLYRFANRPAMALETLKMQVVSAAFNQSLTRLDDLAAINHSDSRGSIAVVINDPA